MESRKCTNERQSSGEPRWVDDTDVDIDDGVEPDEAVPSRHALRSQRVSLLKAAATFGMLCAYLVVNLVTQIFMWEVGEGGPVRRASACVSTIATARDEMAMAAEAAATARRLTPRPFLGDPLLMLLLGGSDQAFRFLLRMPQSSFDQLGQLLFGDDWMIDLTSNHTRGRMQVVLRAGRVGRPPIHPKKALAVFLFVLGHGAMRLRSAALLLNVSASSLKNILERVSRRVMKMMPLQWPDVAEITAIVRSRQGKWDMDIADSISRGGQPFEASEEAKLRRAFACVDGTDFCLAQNPHGDDQIALHGRRSGPRISALCTVAIDTVQFINCVVGFPASTNDVNMLKLSNLYANPRRFGINPTGAGFTILGDAIFRGTVFPYIVTPRSGVSERRDPQCRARNCIERAFGVLKSRFQYLLRMTTELDQLNNSMISAAFRLHNYLMAGVHADDATDFSATIDASSDDVFAAFVEAIEPGTLERTRHYQHRRPDSLTGRRCC